jgi:hypothetical protein
LVAMMISEGKQQAEQECVGRPLILPLLGNTLLFLSR